jgi:hypothetical protein
VARRWRAAGISRGQQIVTLWRIEAPDQAVAFDRRTNVGLHHLALAVADRAGLDALYERVASWPGVVVEFAPELSGQLLTSVSFQSSLKRSLTKNTYFDNY